MKTKLNDIRLASLRTYYDVIVATETWLDDNNHDNELFNHNYTIHRRDRCTTSSEKSGGGGVLIAVSNRIQSKRLTHYESVIEDLWVSVRISENGKTKDLLLCAVYLPSPIQRSTVELFLDNTSAVMESNPTETIIIGDFNMRFIEWKVQPNCNSLIPSNYGVTLGHLLIDFMSSNNLSQFNHFKNSQEKVLDLVLTNLVNVNVSNATDLLSKLDILHPVLEIEISLDTVPILKPKSFATHNFRKADYNTVNAKLSAVDWVTELSSDGEDVNVTLSKFYDIINSIITSSIPKTKHKNSKYPIWFSRALIKIITEKEKVRKRYLKYKNPRDCLELKLLNDRVNRVMKACYADYMKETEEVLKTNPKKFWSYVKSTRGSSSTIPSEMSDDFGNVANSGDSICNLFASKFASVYSQRNQNNNLPNIVDIFPQHSLSSIQVSEWAIQKIIKTIDPSKGAGPDGIPAFFVKMCYKFLSLPLKIIFEKSLLTSSFPSLWKEANVIPIHKKGPKNKVDNYRPISILSHFSKIFECVVCKELTNYSLNIITEKQHGFSKNRSTVSNLVNYITDLCRSVDDGIQVDSIYTDFSKAFDQVDHLILIAKLEYYGMHGNLLRWLESYLKHRTQTVVVNGFRSNPYVAHSGVPQGSHLGPVLFLLFINDITSHIQHSKCSIFADDLKLYRNINTVDDVRLLQSDLDKVQLWCKNNNMMLNPSKCIYIKFTKKKKVINSKYTVGDVIIKEVSEVRDLGVILDSTLSFTNHYDNIIKKSWQMLGFLKRTCNSFRNVTAIKTVYNSLVRSIIEYATTAWNPFYETHSLRLERIQRSFTRYLAYKDRQCPYRADYDTRLVHFNIEKLDTRRKKFDLIFLFKLLNGLVNSPTILSQVGITVPRIRPRYPIQNSFFIPRSRTNVGKYSPINRCMLAYNAVCTNDIDIFHDTLNNFKKKVSLQLT